MVARLDECQHGPGSVDHVEVTFNLEIHLQIEIMRSCVQDSRQLKDHMHCASMADHVIDASTLQDSSGKMLLSSFLTCLATAFAMQAWDLENISVPIRHSGFLTHCLGS